MKLVIALLITVLATLTVAAQSPPTLRIVTETPGLPSELFYGNVKVKPVRLRPGTNIPITINDSDFFVQQQYIDFLSRFPDQSGFGFWKGEIDNCTPKPACTDGSRTNTSGAFFLSIEFKDTGYLAVRATKAAFADADGTSTLGGTHTLKVPIIKRTEFLADQLVLNQGLVVLQPGWEAVLEQNKVNYFNGFVTRSAFTTKYPTSQSPATFVDALFANTGITPSTADRDAAIAEFGGAGNTANNGARARALRKVSENAAFSNAELNRAFVLMQYFGYLRRDPNSGPDTDHTGWEFWLQKLNSFNGNFHQAEMVRSFLVSTEYIDRF